MRKIDEPIWASLRKKKESKQRTLDDSDVAGWFAAADKRAPKPQDREAVLELIKTKNSYRLWRIQHDYKWLEKQMKKLGYSPEDARWLL